MRLTLLALLFTGLGLSACGKKDAPPTASQAAAEPEAPPAPAEPEVPPAVPAPPATVAEVPPRDEAPADDEVPDAPDEEAPSADAPDDNAEEETPEAVGALAPAEQPDEVSAVGVPECDAYVRAAMACLGEAPEASKASQREAFEQVIGAWRAQIEDKGSAIKPALAASCTRAHESAREIMAQMCPDFDWE